MMGTIASAPGRRAKLPSANRTTLGLTCAGGSSLMGSRFIFASAETASTNEVGERGPKRTSFYPISIE